MGSMGMGGQSTTVLPLAKYKLVFLGDQFEGKTSIITRFMYDKFDNTYQATIGILRGVLRAYVAFGVRKWTNVCSRVDKEGVLRSLRQTSALEGLICGCKSSLLSWMVKNMAAPSSRQSMSSVKTSGSEAYYKSNLDLVLKENKQLRQHVDQLEKENRVLKKAIYDLSVRHSACVEQLGHTGKPFDINNIITPESARPESVEAADLSDIVP